MKKNWPKVTGWYWAARKTCGSNTSDGTIVWVSVGHNLQKTKTFYRVYWHGLELGPTSIVKFGPKIEKPEF